MSLTDHENVKKIQHGIIDYMIASHNINWLHDDYERELYALIFNILNEIDWKKTSEIVSEEVSVFSQKRMNCWDKIKFWFWGEKK